MTFLELAKKVLLEVKRPLAPSEIWKFAVSKGYERNLSSKGKTPAQTLYSSIFLDERDNPSTSFTKHGTRPARYYLKVGGQLPEELEKTAESEPSVPRLYDFKESQLHSFLSYFVYTQFGARSKTIRHGTSNKKEYGEWVHPDVISVRYSNWSPDVTGLGMKFGDAGLKLYSFELKRELSFSNLRESFFQAVSNSSWAHEGYLAAADISSDADFTDELRRLSASFGIGVIRIDVEDPDSTEILVPARERPSPDWEALNKLVKLNQDSRDLVSHINKAMTINDAEYGQFDTKERPKPLAATKWRTNLDSGDS